MKTTFIYGLKDPRNGDIRYIGKSNDPNRRLVSHLLPDTSNKEKREWIQSLLADGMTPDVVILERVRIGRWREAERSWISNGRLNGWGLTNILPGGEGYDGDISGYLDDALDGYIDGFLLEKYLSLPSKIKSYIVRNVAIAMVEYVHYGRKLYKISDYMEFAFGSSLARLMVEESNI